MDQQHSIPDDHPLFSPLRLQLITPEIERLRETITQWLWTGATGGYIEGEPRVGKTTALKILSDQFVTRTGAHIPSHLFTVPPRDKPTIQSIYRNLCISADIDILQSTRINSDILLNDFYHFLMDQAFLNQSNRVILFVDEMQRLSISQIEVFAELHDLMNQRDISLTVIFTGNDTESEKLLTAIEERQRRHIHARFFEQSVKFRGITSYREVSNCLKQYDKKRFPEKEGPTYTECFLPKEYHEGFRLQQLARDIWSTYKEDYQAQYHLKTWGMKYFVSCINVLLMDYLPRHGLSVFGKEMLHECIKVSGLIPSRIQAVS